MENKYQIRNYCIVRNRQVIRDGKMLFAGNELKPANFFLEAYKYFGISYSKFHKMDSLCKLGFLASEILLENCRLTERYKGEDIGTIFYNAASSADTDRVHQKSINDREAYFPSPSVFVYTLANIVTGEICIRNKFYGESAFFIEEKFNPAALHLYVSQLFNDGILQCCLTGWLELDGDRYDGVLYLIEKSTPETDGIVIFDPGKLKEIYLSGN